MKLTQNGKVMKKNLTKLAIAIGLSAITSTAMAANLLQVYKQSLRSDPVFAAAKSTWLSGRQDVPISRAALLPQIGIGGAYQYNFLERRSTTSPVGLGLGGNDFQSYGYNITLTQPIIDFQSWRTFRVAKSTAKAADATFAADAQDLMLRVADAYFRVLQAEDDLALTRAQKRADAQQLEQNRQRYKVGIDTITDVYDAKAAYDSDVAQEIADKNTTDNRREDLREISGVYYDKLSSLKRRVPLLLPVPQNIDSWSETSQQQNMELLSARFNEIAAREQIKATRAGSLPVLNAVTGYERSYQGNNGQSTINTHSTDVGAQLTFPIFQGGFVHASTKQAVYNYDTASSTLESVRRQTVDDTRKNYNSVVSGVSKIKADYQAVISNESSYKTTLDSYKVGTRTMVDVLQSQTDLINAQRLLVQDQYTYIIDTLRLKRAAGTLTVKDLEQINSWLSSNSSGRPYYDVSSPKVPTSSGAYKPHSSKAVNKKAV